MPKIGVFDSGIGGESIALAIHQALPDAEILVRSDKQHMPYGDKTPQEVLGYVLPLLESLEQAGCDLIVIACNTVTTHHIQTLRQSVVVPLVGVEPMVKPAAAQTITGIVAVCATPSTLASSRYAELKQLYAQDIAIIEPDCSRWAYMIEHNQVNEELIQHQIASLCNVGADAIVLGCTHYHWIAEKVQAMAQDRAIVIHPEQAVIQRIKTLLA